MTDLKTSCCVLVLCRKVQRQCPDPLLVTRTRAGLSVSRSKTRTERSQMICRIMAMKVSSLLS